MGDLKPREWKFTRTQIMKGEVKYTLDEFYRDMYEWFMETWGGKLGKDHVGRGFNMLIMFLHLRANMKPLDEVYQIMFEEGNKTPLDRRIVDLMEEIHKGDIDILIGIEQKIFLDMFQPSMLQAYGNEKQGEDLALALTNAYIHNTTEDFLRNKGGIKKPSRGRPS